MKIALAALFLLAILSSVPLGAASDPGVAPASDQATLAPASAPGFASWLAGQQDSLNIPSKCISCQDCAQGMSCCYQSDGCALCYWGPSLPPNCFPSGD
jgi:hypothetical protein